MRKFISVRSSALITLLATGLPLSAAALAGDANALQVQRDEGIFRATGLRAEIPADMLAKRSRAVEIVGVESLVSPERNERVAFNLFDDLTVTGVRTDTFAEGKSDFNWVGRLVEDEHAIVSFSRVDGVMHGIIDSPALGQYIVQIAPGGDAYQVIQVDVEALDPCGQSWEQELWFDPSAVGPQSPEEAGNVPDWHWRGERAPAGEIARGEELTVVDVLVVYTQGALNNAGGNPASMQAAIQNWVNNTNAAYNNSGIIQRIRVVHSQLTPYTEHATNMGTDLSRLRSNGDGFIDEVHALRNTYGADTVHLITRQSVGGTCGIAYLLFPGAGSATTFGVTGYTCGWSTFAHELGHNMGCAHDHQNADGNGYRCYSFGYRTPGNTYRTIMAYAPGQRINYFSSPLITFQGFVLGIAENPGCGNDTAADNVRTINETRHVVSGFRPTVVTDEPPAPFNAVNPANGAVAMPLSGFGITWQSSLGAINYDFLLATDPELENIIHSVAENNTTSVAVPLDLLTYNTTYYWSVTARGFAGNTVMSPQVASFRTRYQSDVNSSGAVDFNDLNIVLSQFGVVGSNLIGDVNKDGVVNFLDLNLVLSEFGGIQN